MSINHNHELSMAQTAYFSLWKLTVSVIDEAHQQFNTDIKLYQVLHSLQQSYDVKIISADLYNLKVKLK